MDQSQGKHGDWVVIGVSGVTCGGKTTLANRLKEKLAPVYIFHQDKYFYPDDSPHHIRCKDLEHNNYDILSALDMPGMYQEVVDTMKGDNKAHATCLEGEGSFRAEGKKFLVVEGFSVMNYKPIMDLCHLRYYFVLEYGECARRRSLRLYEPADVAGYFDSCVWPEHLRYRAEIERDPRVRIMDGTRPDAVDTVMDDIRARLA